MPTSEAGGAGDDARQRDRPEVADLVAVDPVHAENRRRVAPDRHERALRERDLPAVAGEDREPEQRDEVHADDRELVRGEVPDQARHEGDQGREHDEARDLECQLDLHARLTVTVPNSPPGRTIRNSRINSSAAGSFSAEPTKPT